ncbi:MAG: hypothetical protein FJ104_10385, partial [Deltaproteobacteria bacterium]|nr:hypothetical protein [Deltaproteobacteria bacterium]
SLAVPPGAPLDLATGTPLNPPPPAGWVWHAVEGTKCRDGSPAGIYTHEGTADGLFFYLEGGGACSSPGFCNFNPASVATSLSGTGETVLGSAAGAIGPRQQPGVYEGNVLRGVFDLSNAANPFKDWHMVYVPYCTGDVHFGSKENGTIPGVAAPQQFVGYRNMQKFVARVVPTFKDRVSQVVLAGSSAGGFGAALNASLVQDNFGEVPVDIVIDSGPPFTDKYMPVCLQQRWRALWGLNDSMPPDCTECRQADGGGMLKLADFLQRKHPNSSIALISSVQDEVIRLFFSTGLKNCASFETADPVAITLGQIDPLVYIPGADYTAALTELRGLYQSTGRFATYYLGGQFHEHLFRQRFFEPAAGGKTIAAFLSDFIAGNNAQVGP